MRTIECTSRSATKNYMPPPLGNGELTMNIDMEGIQRQTARHNETPMIYWAGRRNREIPGSPLIPFGYFEHAIAESPVEWRQELDVTRARVVTDCEYSGGRRVRTEAFIHLDHPIIALRKTFRGAYTCKYILAQPGESKAVPHRLRLNATVVEQGIDIAYEVGDNSELRGILSLFCDRPATVRIDRNEFSLTVEEGPASFFLVFADTLDREEVNDTSRKLKALVREQGFDGLFASHQAGWAEYWRESYLEIPSCRESDVYATSQYHLRISSTRWSIPAGGINACHWNAAYYAFDEYFAFMGLATSGHLAVARRVPEFRFNILLKACLRSFQHWGEENSVDYGARYYFMTDEHGDELTPPGYWLEHIFQMAQVALGAWSYYKYSGDLDFLRTKGYLVIARCAEFYRTQTLYNMGDGRIIVGKCTDLERLGPARENAFMTTCGVIATFEAAAEAAALLKTDLEKESAWRALAAKLRESLPREEGRYVPYPGCRKKSIAVFAGTFPYHILPAADPSQLAAMEDFIANEDAFGNMYPVGNSVCVWYAAWEGVVWARLGRLDKAYACIERVCGETNCFSEVFEISNPVMCPWFCTGEGTFIQMLNECLIQSSDREIRILSYPADDYSFRLAAIGGVMVEARFIRNAVRSLRVEAARPYAGTLRLPDGREFELNLEAGSMTELIGGKE